MRIVPQPSVTQIMDFLWESGKFKYEGIITLNEYRKKHNIPFPNIEFKSNIKILLEKLPKEELHRYYCELLNYYNL